MRFILVAFALLSAVPAMAGSPTIYVIQCTASCVASDGTTQPSGTYLEKILWDGSTTYDPGTGLTAVLYTNQTIYTPAAPTQTAIPVWQFFQRFTTAEFAGLMGNTTAAGVIAKMNAYGQQGVGIVVIDPVITGYMAQAVAAGIITSARSTQILNLAVSSP